MIFHDDTIAAIATPLGEGGIGIVRISGRNALDVARVIFSLSSGISVDTLPTHTAHYGHAVDPLMREMVDDGILTIFRAPHSYTGEDSIEISCHGGMVPMRRVLDAALRGGARLAEPGEFTKRAFMNGRLDLIQAEAVLDIIRAHTDEALRIARQQFEGVLSSKIRGLRSEMIDIIAHIEASIDFPEDVQEWQPGRIVGSIRDAISHVTSLLETANRGKIYREGIQTVITGRPNVGKSSLMNALLREGRAIVTPFPGTTRDIIEESLNIRGIPVRTIDTAGVRETDDPIEKIGVERARQSTEQADLVLLVLDAVDGFTASDQKMASDLGGRKFIIVLNKSDLIRKSDAAELAATVQSWLNAGSSDSPAPGVSKVPILNTAAPSNEGILELEEAIVDTILCGGIPLMDGPIVSNARHRHALEEACAGLKQAVETAQSGMSLDFISIDLKSAVDALGHITGETVADDVIDRIFSEFCIGK